MKKTRTQKRDEVNSKGFGKLANNFSNAIKDARKKATDGVDTSWWGRNMKNGGTRRRK
jgi:hypothetical protein